MPPAESGSPGQPNGPDDGATRLSGGTPPADADATRIGTPAKPDADATRLTAPPVASDPDATRLTAPPRSADPDATRLGAAPESSADATQLSGGAVTGGDSGPLEVGARFGTRYRITRTLGVGGMGAVYEAWDSELGVSVALKVIRSEIADDPDQARELERRFKRELLLARQVTHKNVVRIHDLGEIDGIKYITMPYIEGQDLSHILKAEGKLPLPRALSIARQALAGLVAAHAEGIVHRDLKPANIMVDAQGQALLMDFGIARSVGIAGAELPGTGSRGPRGGDQTMIGAVVGTIQYMAPEQARGQDVDHRADIYAFGLILRNMFLGLGPQKSAATAFQELQQRIDEAPPSMRSVDPSIPETIDRIVTRCLAPDPAARYQQTADLLADIDRIDDEGRLKKEPFKLTRRLAVMASAALLLIVAGTYWLARTPEAVTPDPVSVLIADFDNQTGDAAFEGAVEQAMGVAMEGAAFVTAFSRDSAKRIAESLRPGAKIDESMARLLSRREGIKVVILGSVERDGSGFRVSARAVDPAAESAQAEPLARASASAETRDDVLRAVNRVAATIRSGLGDTATESARLAAGETFTAASLDAVQYYTQAQSLAARGRDAEAVPLYEKAVQADPNFGRAFSGLATSLFHLGREQEAAEQWKKALALMERMSDREKYRTLGTYNLAIAGNYEQAIDNYTTLVSLYPTDLVGHNNLAFAYFSVLNFPKALEEGKRALDLYPNNVVIGNNYALYAMYAGEFDAAAEQAKKLIAADASFVKNYLPLAVASLVKLDDGAARQAYEQMAATGAAGASLAAIGLADQALYRGRWSEAVAVLTKGVADDLARKANGPASEKAMALAEAHEAAGRRAQAVDAAKRALALSRQPSTLVSAARLFARIGAAKDAETIATELENTLQTQNRAWAQIITGDLALRDKKLAQAVDAYRASIKLVDLWSARLALGVTYAEAGRFAEALTELEICQRRRGEATAIFLDDTPTLRRLSTLPYWLGRAQEGVGQRQAAETSYKSFLAIRGEAAKDPLVIDAGRRVGPGAPVK